MKERKLESPKLVIYENVEKVEDILDKYFWPESNEEIAKEILKVLGIPKGKKKVIELFKNDRALKVKTKKDGSLEVEITLNKGGK